MKKTKLLTFIFILNFINLSFTNNFGIYFKDALSALINHDNNQLKYYLELSKNLNCYLDKEELLYEAICMSKDFKSKEIIETLILHKSDPYKIVQGNYSCFKIAISQALFDNDFNAIKFLLKSNIKVLDKDYIELKNSANYHANNNNYTKLLRLLKTKGEID